MINQISKLLFLVPYIINIKVEFAVLNYNSLIVQHPKSHLLAKINFRKLKLIKVEE